jgi:hypothetical protein
MFGNGVGTLSILISDTRERQEHEIWSLSGEAGNSWYQAEVSVSSSNSFRVRINPHSIPFLLNHSNPYNNKQSSPQIVLLGKVGKNNLGDIAVDDISLTPGSCPSK